MKQLIAWGDALGMQIPSLLTLWEVLRTHETWEAGVKDIMHLAGERSHDSTNQSTERDARTSIDFYYTI